MTRNIILCVGLVVMAAGLALSSSNNVKVQEDQLAQINRDISAEQDRIRVLTAEWHTLKAPERLEALTQRHLPTYHPATPTQIATLAALLDPLPAAVAEAPVAAEKPVEVAAVVAPAARATLPKVTPPQPRIVAQARVRAQPASATIETIIAQTENPFRSAVTAERAQPRHVNDELSELIERQPTEGVLWASAGGRE